MVFILFCVRQDDVRKAIRSGFISNDSSSLTAPRSTTVSKEGNPPSDEIQLHQPTYQSNLPSLIEDGDDNTYETYDHDFDKGSEEINQDDYEDCGVNGDKDEDNIYEDCNVNGNEDNIYESC